MPIDASQPLPPTSSRALRGLARLRATVQPAWVPLCVVLAGAGLMHASTLQARRTAPSTLSAARVASHLHVPEGFTIERVAGPDLLDYPMYITPAGEGRLFVFESTEPNTMTTEEMLAVPSYHVRLLEDTDLDGVYDTSRIFADRLPFPMGGEVIGDDLFVAAAPDLLRLRDTNGDGVADEREVVLTGWTLNVNGAAMGGPFRGPDGWLYITDARRGFEIRRKEGDVVSGKGARIWRVRPDGTGLEWISGGGFDNAVEITFLPTGETFGTMTYFLDPQDGLRDAIMHWVEGGVYPKYNQVIDEDALTLTGPLMPPMTKLARVAHSGILRYRSRVFGAEFQGNLFTAQFNTGRVMRHVLTPDGATYRTDDEPFMTSTSADAHPTDVLEDADGSLLVVETGGWFIKGCPLSRVAKPEVEGGIYRIRRTDAPAIADPWGHRLGLDTAAPDQLVTYLHDARPAVRDKAAEHLVAAGAATVGALDAYRRRADDAEARAAAVFALHRIGTPEAHAAVRAALDDADAMVRTAAARAVGLARDAEAVPALERLVRTDAPGVRRQAATALGQVGTATSVRALVDAAGQPGDRFVQHAVTHALITLGDTSPLIDALTHASRDVRRVALIALDQMRPSPLRREHLAPFLAPDASNLWDTGVWVASHHPEWSELVVSFLTARMDATAATATTDEVRDLMVTFCGESPVQALVATRLAAATTPVAQRLTLLDVMQACPVKTLPASWVVELETQLQADDAALRAGVLRLVEARSVTALHPRLAAIVADAAVPLAFRLDALSSLSTGRRPLGDAERALVTASLDPAHEPTVRQRAARILAQAGLTDAQLEALAREHVATADAFLLPRLVDAFAGNTSVSVGRALVAALQGAPERLDTLSEDDISSLLGAYPAVVQSEAERLMQTLRNRHAERLARLQAVEATLGRGDIDAGRRLFFGKSLCSTCHAVGSNGSRFGPDLTSIGDIRSRHDIVEAILFPSASFAREYDTYRVRTATAVHTGIVKDELADALIVEVAPESAIRVPRSEVQAIEPLGVSMMPPGLEQMLTASELADLVAFLESLPDPVVVLERQSAPR